MTKLRVHELAKELGMENKDLMEILEKKNVEAKTSMSSIPDEVVAELRSGHAGKGTSEDAPKKKNIVQVFRPQNSKSGNRRPGGSRPGNGQNSCKQHSKCGKRQKLVWTSQKNHITV